ncbi:hypothetical protein V8E36_008208 [Tilletia maclaganii]
MKLSTVALLSLLSASAFAQHRSKAHKHQHKVKVKTHATSAASSEDEIHTGKGTFYNVAANEVACSGYYKPSEFVVALNQDQYGSLNSHSRWCNRRILIKSHGKSAVARIVDACPRSKTNCHMGALDMSKGLFEWFAKPTVGVIDIEWHFLPLDWSEGESENGPAHQHTSQHHPHQTEQHGSSSSDGQHHGSGHHKAQHHTPHGQTHQYQAKHHKQHHHVQAAHHHQSGSKKHHTKHSGRPQHHHAQHKGKHAHKG